MDKANLLINIDSFRWEDQGTDRSTILDDLILAHELASEHGDHLYSHPECYTLHLTWGNFYEILFYTEDKVRQSAPWLRNDHQLFLINIWNRATTHNNASDLEELELEFPHQNNGLFGVFEGQIQEKYVNDQASWEKLHQNFVRNNPFFRKTHPAYFTEFFIPGLTLSANQINTMIQKEQVHGIFERLDTPTQLEEGSTLHREQIQMHFKDAQKSALNIDGTWKHGGFNIPADALNQLCEWGFRLPEDQL